MISLFITLTGTVTTNLGDCDLFPAKSRCADNGGYGDDSGFLVAGDMESVTENDSGGSWDSFSTLLIDLYISATAAERLHVSAIGCCCDDSRDDRERG